MGYEKTFHRWLEDSCVETFFIEHYVPRALFTHWGYSSEQNEFLSLLGALILALGMQTDGLKASK